MKKTTYMIIALLVVILLGEVALMIAVRSTGIPLKEHLREIGLIVEDTEDGGYIVSVPDHETEETIEVSNQQEYIQLIIPKQLKQELGISDGPLNLDTLVIPNPDHNIIIY